MRLHFVATNQETSNAVIDMIVGRPVGNQPRSRRFSRSRTRPRRLVSWNQDLADLLLEPSHALLQRARAQIPMAVLPIVVRSERIPQKIKALPPSISDRCGPSCSALRPSPPWPGAPRCRSPECRPPSVPHAAKPSASKPQDRLTVSAICAGSVTGSEQVCPTHTNAAGPCAAFTLA